MINVRIAEDGIRLLLGWLGMEQNGVEIVGTAQMPRRTYSKFKPHWNCWNRLKRGVWHPRSMPGMRNVVGRAFE